MKFWKRTLIVLALSLFLAGGATAVELDSRISVNLKDASLRNTLEMLAARAGLRLALDFEPDGKSLTLIRSDVTARQLLDQLSTDYELSYAIRDGALIVTRRSLSAGGVGLGGGAGPQLIQLTFANASELAQRIQLMLGNEEKLLIDNKNNSLIYAGNEAGFQRVKNLVQFFDRPPKQIMIEAQIVETSNQFLREIGVSLGDSSNRGLSADSSVSAYSGTGKGGGNFGFRAILGRLDGRALEAKLNVAQLKGDAKLISRPKIVTMNNEPASINSGINYTIKTLSAVQGGSGGAAATGGISTVSAGLSLNITPTIVGEEKVRLSVNINNSTPDESSAVDGIPGVLTNAATTSVIVRNAETTVIAGLVKQSRSRSRTGVPILMDMPLLGGLFRNDNRADRNNELVIFITPTIDGAWTTQSVEQGVEPANAEPAKAEPAPGTTVEASQDPSKVNPVPLNADPKPSEAQAAKEGPAAKEEVKEGEKAPTPAARLVTEKEKEQQAERYPASEAPASKPTPAAVRAPVGASASQ